MTKRELQEMLEREYLNGVADGKKMYEQKLRDAIASGSPIELDGRAWHLQSDVEYLRERMGNYGEKQKV